VLATIGPVPVEWGKALEIARATLDPDAERFRPSRSTAPGLAAPPTYTMVLSHWGASIYDFPAVPLDPDRTLDGEHAFTYHRAPRIGDWLTATVRFGGRREHAGRSTGAFGTVAFDTTFHDHHGKLVLTHRRTVVVLDQPPRWTDPAVPPPEAEGGGSWTAPPLTHSHFVRYGGALGEFNPVHEDPAAAARAGYPDIFAQGMLVGGILAARLRAAVGQPATLRMRFVAPVFRDDVLTFRWRPAAGDATRVEAEVRNQHHRPVLLGWAGFTGGLHR
jgi:acyl dehydratase